MLLDNIFEKFANSIDFKGYISTSSNLIFKSLVSTPIIEYLELCNLHSLDLLYKKTL